MVRSDMTTGQGGHCPGATPMHEKRFLVSFIVDDQPTTIEVNSTGDDLTPEQARAHIEAHPAVNAGGRISGQRRRAAGRLAGHLRRRAGGAEARAWATVNKQSGGGNRSGGSGQKKSSQAKSADRSDSARQAAATRQSGSRSASLADQTKEQLMKKARAQNIRGRSTMRKQE